MATGFSRSLLRGSDSFKGSFTEGSDETFDIICNPCEDRNNSIVEANFYCSMCDDFCCKLCLQVHNSFKGNKSHQIYGRDQMDMWGQQVRGSMLPTTVCPDHPGETLQMFCMKDQLLCCNVCVSLIHRTCPGMTYVPKLANGIKDSEDLSTVDQTIGQFIELVNEMIKTDNKAKTSIDKSKADYKYNIKNVRKQVDVFFDSLVKKADLEIDKYHADSAKNLLKHMKDLNDINDTLAHIKTAIQPSSTNNESQLFIEMFTAQQQFPLVKQGLQKLAETQQTTRFHLNQNNKIQEMLDTVKNLGEMKLETSTIRRKLPDIKQLTLLQPHPPCSSVAASPSSSTSSTTTTPPPSVPSRNTNKQIQTQLYIATNERDVNVKIKSDKNDCKIYGSCQMPSGDILLTDYANKKVKRLNTKYKPTDYLDLPDSPSVICCMGDTEAVVTDENRTLHFLSINISKMSMTRSIKLDHTCFGIAHHNRRLFVSNLNNKVYIYTTSGQCIKTLQTDNNGLEMFFETQHICVSPDGSKIYVADYGNGLVTLDGDGNHLSTYDSKDLFGVCDVSVDSQGRVVLCAWGSHNIHQLDEGGSKFVGEVVGITYPWSVCIDNHNSTLIVGVLGYTRIYNHIKVFDLQ